VSKRKFLSVIYDPRITEAANLFIRARLDAIKRHCWGCELVGVCRGSCILSGLDSRNELNPAACAYQKTLWARFLKYDYDCEERAAAAPANEATTGGTD